MNRVRHDLPELGDVGGSDLPPDPPDTGGGGSRPEPTPRRDHRQWLPWLGLGAALLAVERLALITMAMRGLSAETYAMAALVFIAMVLAGLFFGGRAFHRAYHAAQNRPPPR